MIGSVIKSARLWYYRQKATRENRSVVHFLHIGKSGGTAIKSALNIKNKPLVYPGHVLFAHPHNFTLMDVPEGEKVFFVVRDPVDRFVSGFYSRKRKGMPRIYREWTKGEEEAFRWFDTPNELAMALCDQDEPRAKAAAKAMKEIYHVKSSYWDWFENETYFLTRLNDVIFVGTQKTLNQDFQQLKKTLNLPEYISLPDDDVNTHKNPDSLDKSLDSVARKNLKNWYAQDYRFLELLKEQHLID